MLGDCWGARTGAPGVAPEYPPSEEALRCPSNGSPILGALAARSGCRRSSHHQGKRGRWIVGPPTARPGLRGPASGVGTTTERIAPSHHSVDLPRCVGPSRNSIGATVDPGGGAGRSFPTAQSSDPCRVKGKAAESRVRANFCSMRLSSSSEKSTKGISAPSRIHPFMTPVGARLFV